MSPDRLRECLDVLHWSQRGLADILGLDERQVRRCAAGQSQLRDGESAWLERRARAMEADPPPRRARAA